MKLRSLLLVLTTWLVLSAALPARAQDPGPALEVARSFYTWYVKHNDNVWKQLHQVKPLFEAELYKKLQAWYQSGTVDFDPFCNAQWSCVGYTLGAVKFERDFALIPVTCKLGRGGKSNLTLVLHRAVDHYEIWNFVYTKDFDLRTMFEKKS